MNINGFCAEAAVILAEQAGARFTGKIVFEVNLRDGGISQVNVTKSGAMKAEPDPEGRVARYDKPS